MCKSYGRQFVESYEQKGYSHDVKQICLKMYLNGLGLRGIERVTGINHNTIINWMKMAALAHLEAPEFDEILEITDLDELQGFVGAKKTRSRSGLQSITSGYEL
jgi:hypothetical protein